MSATVGTMVELSSPNVDELRLFGRMPALVGDGLELEGVTAFDLRANARTQQTGASVSIAAVGADGEQVFELVVGMDQRDLVSWARMLVKALEEGGR